MSSDDTKKDSEIEQRGFWDTRVAYWLAACGSAVGLGNLWRFPNQVYSNGGGAFLVAYFVCLFLVGMPLLTQEMALGKMFRGGDVEAYGRISPRLRGIGLASVVGAYGIVTYYSVVIAWSLRYFFASWANPLPWEDNPGRYFTHIVLNRSDNIYDSAGEFNGWVAGCNFIVWVVVYVAVMYGVKSMSKVVLVSMPVPILILIVLLIRGSLLPGALDGVASYLSTDLSVLEDIGVWNAAIGQMFFSLSICMGVMTAYSSYTKKEYSVATDEKVVAFCDVGIAFLSGFVVYTILGYLKHEGNAKAFSEAGLGLVFVAFPTALATLDAANFFSVIFFFTLFLLGIDSAFSMVEAVATVILDIDAFSRISWLTRPVLNLIICVSGFILSLVYCFDSGLFWFDIVDRFINNYGMLFIGMMECVALGWVFKWSEQVEVAGALAVNIWGFCYWGGLFTGTVVGMAMATFVSDNAAKCEGHFEGGQLGFWVGVLVTLVFWAVGFVASFIMGRKRSPNASAGALMWGIFGWEGADFVRTYVNKSSDPNFTSMTSRYEVRALWDCSMLTITWGWQIKYFIPTILFLLLADICRTSSYMRYGCYAMEHLALGIFLFVLMVFFVVIIAIFPSLMAQEWDNISEEEKMKKVEITNMSKDGETMA